MPVNTASLLLVTIVVATILPPGYPAYIGAYIGLAAALVATLLFGWRNRSALAHPTALAILGAIVLLAATLPFVYRSAPDLLAPILILPMLAAVALGLLARQASWVPPPFAFALLCLLAAFIALSGAGYERYGQGVYRPGLGNNPIHFATLAAMSGCLALVGVAAGTTPWRYVFFLGPIVGVAAAVVADSRGPMVGAAAMSAIGILALTTWFWRETGYRLVLLASAAVATAATAMLMQSGNARVAGIFDSAVDIFRFAGGGDDVRAALYMSALDALRSSPVFGIGLGQIMTTAQRMFPEMAGVTTFDHLHADWANFATMAGGMGLLAWILLLAAPLLLLVDTNARRDRPLVMGALLLSVGQFTFGISNATFGILPQTTVYAVAIGYFFVRARRLADPTKLPA